jgi:hypothetical protein
MRSDVFEKANVAGKIEQIAPATDCESKSGARSQMDSQAT